MKESILIGRLFYGLAMIVYGIQQVVYADFRNVQLPAWQSHIPILSLWSYMTGIGLVIAGAGIILEKKGRELSLALGGTFLFLFVFVHIPFEFFGEVHSSTHLALWLDALKELALSGGAFVIAGSFSTDREDSRQQATPLKILEKMIPLGRLFFSIPMLCFGIMHFLYTDHVATLMPVWFPDPIFWTYLSGVALISAGLAIVLKIRLGIISMLLCIMIFLWFVLLHVPRALADPFISRGNELSSAFDALAFSGTALVIALRNFKSDFNELLTNV